MSKLSILFARVCFLPLLLFAFPAWPSTICYVSAAATDGANNGTSWLNAFTDLQSALSNPSCPQIWVARGLYKPTTTTDRTISFNVPRGRSLYGGFAGGESQINQRTPGNETILSGDIGVAKNSGDNSYHVVRLDGTTAAGTITQATNVIDGFTIADGFAAGAVPGPDSRGAGLYCDGTGLGHECSPMLNNLNFVDNVALDWAGGAYFDGEAFGFSSPLLTNSTFSGNNAHYGGGLMCSGQGSGVSNPTIANVTFSGNSATQSAAAGGGLYNAAYNSGTSNPTLINVTFTENTATGRGGALLDDGRASGHSNPTLTNIILWGDTAGLSGYNEIGLLDDFGGVAVLPTINDSVVQGGCPINNPAIPICTNVYADDPLLGALGYNGGLTPTIAPKQTGSAIDRGNDAACAAAPVNDLDQRGVSRLFGAHCDIGAVEFSDRIFGDGFE